MENKTDFQSEALADAINPFSEKFSQRAFLNLFVRLELAVVEMVHPTKVCILRKTENWRSCRYAGIEVG